MEAGERRIKLAEILKEVSNYEWTAFDNKHTVGLTFRHWMDKIDALYIDAESSDGTVHLTRFMTDKCSNHKHASQKPKEGYVQCKRCGWYVERKIK